MEYRCEHQGLRRNQNCETLLGRTAVTCSYEMAQLLVNAGVNPTIPGWMQMTVSYRAKNGKMKKGKRSMIGSKDKRRLVRNQMIGRICLALSLGVVAFNGISSDHVPSRWREIE